jgi:hypothetical protein
VVYREDVGTLGEAPANWVKHPNEGCVACAATIQTLVTETRLEPTTEERVATNGAHLN